MGRRETAGMDGERFMSFISVWEGDVVEGDLDYDSRPMGVAGKISSVTLCRLTGVKGLGQVRGPGELFEWHACNR